MEWSIISKQGQPFIDFHQAAMICIPILRVIHPQPLPERFFLRMPWRTEYFEDPGISGCAAWVFRRTVPFTGQAIRASHIICSYYFQFDLVVPVIAKIIDITKVVTSFFENAVQLCAPGIDHGCFIHLVRYAIYFLIQYVLFTELEQVIVLPTKKHLVLLNGKPAGCNRAKQGDAARSWDLYHWSKYGIDKSSHFRYRLKFLLNGSAIILQNSAVCVRFAPVAPFY